MGKAEMILKENEKTDENGLGVPLTEHLQKVHSRCDSEFTNSLMQEIPHYFS